MRYFADLGSLAFRPHGYGLAAKPEREGYVNTGQTELPCPAEHPDRQVSNWKLR